MMIQNEEDIIEEAPLEQANTAEVLGALFGGEGDGLEKAGVYMLMDDIKNESVRPAIEWIFRNNLSSNQPEYLTLIINSGGGSVTDAFALIDTMKGSGIPIHTIGLGEVSSAALMIFMAGERGHRILTPNTAILSHQYSWGSYGKEHELFAQVKEYELSSRRLVTHYKRCTGLTEKDIKQYLLPPEDVWLSGQEAKKLGICDNIRQMS